MTATTADSQETATEPPNHRSPFADVFGELFGAARKAAPSDSDETSETPRAPDIGSALGALISAALIGEALDDENTTRLAIPIPPQLLEALNEAAQNGDVTMMVSETPIGVTIAIATEVKSDFECTGTHNTATCPGCTQAADRFPDLFDDEGKRIDA